MSPRTMVNLLQRGQVSQKQFIKEYPLPDSTSRKLENVIHAIDVSEEFGKM